MTRPAEWENKIEGEVEALGRFASNHSHLWLWLAILALLFGVCDPLDVAEREHRLEQRIKVLEQKVNP